jgi:hypothetical protein
MPLHPHLDGNGEKAVLTRAAALGIEVDKWLQTQMEAPKLNSLAAQASHER